jgi:hypothetical protein
MIFTTLLVADPGISKQQGAVEGWRSDGCPEAATQWGQGNAMVGVQGAKPLKLNNSYKQNPSFQTIKIMNI